MDLEGSFYINILLCKSDTSDQKPDFLVRLDFSGDLGTHFGA